MASTRPNVRMVTAANCWAHTRRHFERAKDIVPAAVAEARDIIGALYRVERKIKDKCLEGEAKLQARSQHARHVGLIQSLMTTCWLHNVNPYT